ncbi:MAG: sarcosine oxidase subunit gamma family protein [Casimicrobiaceae bacterium]
MSEHQEGDIGSAAPGHYGVGATGVTLSAPTIAAAWNVQGDPARAPFIAGVQQLFGVPFPTLPNTTKRGNALLALWLGPRSWLLVETGASTVPRALTGFAGQRDAVNALGGALFDVSAGRVAYRVRGVHAAAVLAKNCPLDFHPDVFLVGGCAQSLFGHVNALYYREDATPSFVVLVARSFGRDVWRLLCSSSAQYGYDVAAPTPFAANR